VRLKIRTCLAIFLVLALLASSCHSPDSFGEKLGAEAAPHQFSIVRWEIRSLSQEVKEFFSENDSAPADDSQAVIDYFAVMDKINAEQQAIDAITSGTASGDAEAHFTALASLEEQRDSLATRAEYVLEAQMRTTLNSLGIYNPTDSFLNFKFTFPPVKLRLQEPPKLLVVSPRDNISRLATITLDNNMSIDQITALENSVSDLNVSALIVDLGGIATYPSFVANRYGLQFALSTAAEEWFHQYNFFRPLGFRYGLEELGRNEPDYIVTMNETLAGMVSEEVGLAIYDKYYASFFPPPATTGGGGSTSGFNFNTFMHDTRVTVDDMLAQGQITQAESYMEQQRLILAAHGYFIRKLNQAFFAFYGSYADQPGFENPIADNFTTLRADSASLAAFVEKASGFTNPDELAQAVK
jgi:hypothetical protein